MVNCNFDYLSYTADICENNHENDFYSTIAKIKIEKNHIYSSCIYSDIDNKK